MRCLLCIRRMTWKDDTDTERRRGREGAYFISVARPEETIQIQRDEEDEKVPALYPSNGLKRRCGYRETKRKMRCLLCIRRMVWRDDADTERRRWRGREREVVYFVSVGWFEETIRIQRRRGKEGACFISVESSEETMRLQRDEEDEGAKVPSLYPQNGLKIRHGYRETKRKRKRRCLLYIRSTAWKDDTDTERRRARRGACFVPAGWSETTMQIQRDEEDEEEKVPSLCS